MLIDVLPRGSSAGQFVFTCFLLILSSSERRVLSLEPPSFKLGDKVVLETSLSCGVGMFENEQDSMTRCASANEGRKFTWSLLFLQSLISRFAINKELCYILTKWFYKTSYDTKLALHVPYKAFTFFPSRYLTSTCHTTLILAQTKPAYSRGWLRKLDESMKEPIHLLLQTQLFSIVLENFTLSLGLRAEKEEIWKFSSQPNRLFWKKTSSFLTFTLTWKLVNNLTFDWVVFARR